jgi:N-methylhydantoinase A
MFAVGIDMGGTFTDGYVTDGIRATVCKVPTTHFDLSRSVTACLRQAAEWFELDLAKFLADIDLLRVATTIGTNAVVEGTGDLVGLLVESGAERTLYGRREPAAALGRFVREEHVRGVPVDEDADVLLAHCRELVLLGVRRVVVSFRGEPSAEQRVRELAADRYPEHYLRSIPLSLGSETAAVADDEIRTNTAILNAYVSRPMAKLLYHTEGLLQQEGLRVPLLAVRSDASCGRVARTMAIATYSSGPASGLALVANLATAAGDSLALGFDMGGTTLDVGLVRDGRPPIDTEPEIRGVRVALPVPGIVSVGLGGSSIAERAGNGAVVGPASAGAIPGPACFGRGGALPTVTDADLVLGFLDHGERFAAEIELLTEPARSALEREFETSAENAAVTVRSGADASAAGAVEGVLEHHGVDPGAVTLYAFGGAGPLHAAAVADHVGIKRIRSFAFGPVFSARGVAGVDVRQGFEAIVDDGEEGRDVVSLLIRRAVLDLEAEGLDATAATVVLSVDPGDGEPRELGPVMVGELTAALDARPDALSGASRLRLTTVLAPPSTPDVDTLGGSPSGHRSVRWGADWLPTDVRGSDDLDDTVVGPALVLLAGAVHAVPPGWSCRSDRLGLLWTRTR